MSAAAVQTCWCRGPALRSYTHEAHMEIAAASRDPLRAARIAEPPRSWGAWTALTEKQRHVALDAALPLWLWYHVVGSAGGPSRRSTLHVEALWWTSAPRMDVFNAVAVHDRFRDRQRAVARRLGADWACGPGTCVAAFRAVEEEVAP